MAKEFPHFDFSPVDPVYPDKTSPAGKPYAFTRTAVLGRGQRCLAALAARPEKVIAVVSHSGFLRTAVSGMRYANADYRIFDFTGNGTEIKEWDITREPGGGMGRCDKQPSPMEPGDFPEEPAVADEATAEIPAKK
jgi:broad specificity phosphatase PhoE